MTLDKVYVSLAEWAEDHGLDPATCRQRAARGSFRTARKIGRNWIIDRDEPLVDHRKKSSKELG